VDSVLTLSATFPASQLTSNSSVVVRGNPLLSNDVYQLSYVKIHYPRAFSFGGAAYFQMALDNNGQRRYLELTNVDASNASSQQMYVYDVKNKERIQCFWDGTKARVDLSANLSHNFVLEFANLGSSNGINTVGRLDRVNFTNFRQQNPDYIIVSHPRLYQNSTGQNPIFDYAAYRASTGFNPIVVDINELYNQFAYGIEYHPLSVRNFAQFAKTIWTNPEYLFLIGKARVTRDVRNAQTLDFFIPTFGHPPSDNLLASTFTSDAPVIALGRLAATSGDQVSTYLQKIRDVESWRTAPQTPADIAWTKNVLHLGGGGNSTEQGIIRANLNLLENTIEQPRFGANVTSFYKTSTSPIQSAQSAYLDSLINNGVSIITFFGHSSANSFDFNLDYPDRYNNYKKYPLIMALGCYGGTIFEDGQRISENFIFEPEAGASVFLASVGAAALGALNDVSTRFYSALNSNNYGKGAAKSLQTAILSLEQSGFYSVTQQMVSNYMCYHGDPAFNLNARSRPDYYVDNSLISHSPATVSTRESNFSLNINPLNLGEAIDTVFWLQIDRQYPDGSVQTVTRQQIQAPYFSENITIPVPVNGTSALGLNYFTVKIDDGNEIDEAPNPSAEMNNIAIAYPVLIVSDAVLPVYPEEFAIVINQPITLKASTGNALAPLQTYVFQIDTTAYFNSPLFRQQQITQVGGLLQWTPNLTYTDSTVYYWRVSVDSVSPQAGYEWQQTSFMYLGNSYEGWNQSHYFQFLRDQSQNFVFQEPSRKFEFITTDQELFSRNGFTPNPLNNEVLATYLNGSRIEKCNCTFDKGVFVQVIDPNTASAWGANGRAAQVGAVNCDLSGRPYSFFLFRTNVPNNTQAITTQENLAKFIQDTVPDGHFINIMTLNDAGASRWSSTGNLYQALLAAGATQAYLDTLISRPDGVPYSLFFKKGFPNYQFNRDTVGYSKDTSIIELSGLMEGNWNEGNLRSTIIGAANEWTHFYWETASDANIQNDSVWVNIYGLDSNQLNPRLLISKFNGLDTSLLGISALQYPYLQLEWISKDPTNQTSANLRYWRILADIVPEAAIRPELLFTMSNDSLQAGENLRVKVAFQNISTRDMDSVLVKFQLTGQAPIYKRFANLPAGDTLHAWANIPTQGISGQQSLFIEINPDGDQRELYRFNNLLLIPIQVENDRINPVLDVSFDGEHIFNGDLVSAKPEILIQLSDENAYLALNNPQDFTVLLRHPQLPNGEISLDSSSTNAVFIPATGNLARENKAQLILRPEFTHDGKYTMYVSAKDRSNNNAGTLSYSVDFEVLNKQAISNVLNYPNPFTSQTQFVFTLTGSELPDELYIQIFNINGKLVKQIEQAELGSLRIGLNRTDYAWDGTDMYGDRLANGVYLYKVVAKKGGQELDAYNNKRIDFMFQNGFGKMYLMR